jgi:carbamoyltransferase
MAAILGISAFYHDSAAALVVDGRVVAAAQEERFTRKKHDPAFPSRAVEYCLSEAGLTAADLDWVGFYDKPLLKFERLLETYLAYAPAGFRSFGQALPLWVREKLFLPRTMSKALGGAYKKRFVFAEHHETHAASAFYPSPFEEAAILTVDGVGEWATASLGVGRGASIELTHQLRFPHSLGLLYSAFTYYCGFRVNSGEYKLMGLAPYGEPRFADLILKNLIDLKDDGSFRMDQSYFQYAAGLTMTSGKLHQLLGAPPRKPESPLTQREMDLAASIQVVTESILLKMARHVHALTGLPNLVMAGGVALNCVANGVILREGPFERLWVQPAAGDAGGALGVALLIHHQLLEKPRTPDQPDGQSGSLLGPSYSDAQIERFLRSVDAPFEHFEDDEALCEAVAEHLADGAVVGWFQGRMEFGPRSLGSRSLLGDARDPEMQSTMNLKIKFRESFRPFAPSVLAERAADYFDMPRDCDSPYMLVVAQVNADQRVDSDDSDHLFGIDKLKVPRSTIPAVTHVDGSARVQTVDDARNPLYARLLRAFERRTGCPVLINTSFNVRGEPIVESPLDAYRGFLATGVDVLALGHFLVKKADQRPMAHAEVEAHLAQFPLD